MIPTAILIASERMILIGVMTVGKPAITVITHGIKNPMKIPENAIIIVNIVLIISILHVPIELKDLL